MSNHQYIKSNLQEIINQVDPGDFIKYKRYYKNIERVGIFIEFIEVIGIGNVLIAKRPVSKQIIKLPIKYISKISYYKPEKTLEEQIKDIAKKYHIEKIKKKNFILNQPTYEEINQEYQKIMNSFLLE